MRKAQVICRDDWSFEDEASAAKVCMAMQAQWLTLLSAPAMAGTLALAGLAGFVSGFYPALMA